MRVGVQAILKIRLKKKTLQNCDRIPNNVQLLGGGHYLRVGGGRCKSENRSHSKFAPLDDRALRFCPPLKSCALKFRPPPLMVYQRCIHI